MKLNGNDPVLTSRDEIILASILGIVTFVIFFTVIPDVGLGSTSAFCFINTCPTLYYHLNNIGETIVIAYLISLFVTTEVLCLLDKTEKPTYTTITEYAVRQKFTALNYAMLLVGGIFVFIGIGISIAAAIEQAKSAIVASLIGLVPWIAGFWFIIFGVFLLILVNKKRLEKQLKTKVASNEPGSMIESQ